MSAETPIAFGSGVRWIGAQRDILAGDLQGQVELEAPSAVPHLMQLRGQSGHPS